MKARLIPLPGRHASLEIRWSPDAPQPKDSFDAWLGTLVRSLSIALEFLPPMSLGEPVVVLAKRQGNTVLIEASKDCLMAVGEAAMRSIFRGVTLDELVISVVPAVRHD